MHGSVLGLFLGVLSTAEVEGKRVLEVGSLDVNVSIRPMVEARRPAEYIGVDVVDGPGVDRVVDAERLVDTFGHSAFDVVVCCETMEHVENWARTLANMVTVLAPGGVLVITTRSPGFAYHHPPDRWRYTHASFAQMAEVLGLHQMLLADDPEYPGIFWKVSRPAELAQHQPLAPYSYAAQLSEAGAVDGVTPMAEPLRSLWLPANPDGCGYYRMWQPATAMQRAGESGVVIPPPGRHQFVPNVAEVEEFQVVIAQRPGGRQWAETWEWWKARTGARLVYEVDDLILNADTSLPHWQDDAVTSTVRRCMEAADLITVSTPALADAFAAELTDCGDRIRVVPNRIHADLLSLGRVHDPDRAATRVGLYPQEVTIGWAGGATHVRDVAMIQDPLRSVLAKTGAGMHFVGDDLSSLVAPEAARAPQFTPWQPHVWDYYRAIDFDIGVIPLTRTAFNDCRSEIKALEYAALGIPVVASDVPAYRQFVKHGVTGFLVKSAEEWRDALLLLIERSDLRAKMGADARAWAAEWTIQEHWAERADAFRALTA